MLEENKMQDDNLEDFNEVIELTEYEGDKNVTPYNGKNYVTEISEYNKIDTKEVDEICQQQAKKLVDKIKTFIIKYGGEDLDEDMQSYISSVAELEISGLSDMLQMCYMNKMMIQNIVNRINETFGEDAAAVQSYNQLVSLHIKLMKELQLKYKTIPTTIKRMKTDVITEQYLPESGDNTKDVIGENYGETQFNNGRELFNMLSEDSKTE